MSKVRHVACMITNSFDCAFTWASTRQSRRWTCSSTKLENRWAGKQWGLGVWSGSGTLGGISHRSIKMASDVNHWEPPNEETIIARLNSELAQRKGLKMNRRMICNPPLQETCDDLTTWKGMFPRWTMSESKTMIWWAAGQAPLVEKKDLFKVVPYDQWCGVCTKPLSISGLLTMIKKFK